MWYNNVGTTFFRFVTDHAFDRRTDRRIDSFLVASPRWHSMQHCKIGIGVAQRPTIIRSLAPAPSDLITSIQLEIYIAEFVNI